MQNRPNILSILKIIPCINMLLYLFIMPACVPFAVGMIYGIEQNKVEVVERIKAIKKIDYIRIVKNLGEMEGYNISTGGPLDWGRTV